MKKLAEESFLRLPQVLELIPVCKSAWWQGCKEGRFPKADKTGAAYQRMANFRHRRSCATTFPAGHTGGKPRNTGLI